MTPACDIAVVGGGLVGRALAFGLARLDLTVALFDPEEDDQHASVGNFGLVWVQGKGIGAPDYAALSARSARAWNGFAEDLSAASGIETQYSRTGGVKIALSEAELDAMQARHARAHNEQAAAGIETRLIDQAELAALLPSVGPEALGASYCAEDGHADPLFTLRALALALSRQPRVAVWRATVEAVTREGGGFVLRSTAGPCHATRVVLAAGLGSTRLAAGLGIRAPLRPQRGQVLVTQRLPDFLPLATHQVRQTGAGSVLIGDSKEDAGFDRGVTSDVGGAIAARAIRAFPALREARIVRHWGSLRVMSPDGLPIYAQSPEHPGAMLVTCHSGVTLAAAHAGEVARAIADDRLAANYPAFSPGRFAEAAA